jgi:hypothetical protein
VISLGEVRTIALALPEATETEHWGNPSFRVYGRIFATVPNPAHLNVMVDPFDVDAVVREVPEGCSPLHWGKQVRGVKVTLASASAASVANLLEVARRRKAPRRLLGRSDDHQNLPPPRTR